MSGVLLFDLDGTLVDADHIHHEAWRRMMSPFGVEISVERYRSEVMGFPNDIIMRRLAPDMPADQALRLSDDKEALFRTLATDLEPAPGLAAFLDWLDARGTRYGVVTNAPRLNAEQELAGIGMAGRFGMVVIGDELEHAKPHPLPYLTGLDRLGGTAGRSIAFEDSLSGLSAARAAGLAVVGLTTGLSAERLIEAGAALAIPHFADARLQAFVSARLDGESGAAAASA